MNLDERCEMVEARVAYDKDPRGYQKLAAEESEALTNKLNESRARLNQVTLDPALSLKVRRPSADAHGLRVSPLSRARDERDSRRGTLLDADTPVLHACRCLRCARSSTWMACAATSW